MLWHHALRRRDDGCEESIELLDQASTFIALPHLCKFKRVLRKTVCIDQLSARQGLILKPE